MSKNTKKHLSAMTNCTLVSLQENTSHLLNNVSNDDKYDKQDAKIIELSQKLNEALKQKLK